MGRVTRRSPGLLGRRLAAGLIAGLTALALAGCAVLPWGTGSAGVGKPLPSDIPSDSSLRVRVPDEVKQDGTLTVALALTEAPLASLESGEPAGAEVDLATALAAVLGLRVEIVPEQTSRIDFAVGRGDYDLGIGSLVADPEVPSASAKVGYLSADLRLAVPRNETAAENIRWLCGRTVAQIDGIVDEDTFSELDGICDDAGLASPRLLAVEDYAAAMREVDAQRAAGIVGPAPDLAALVTSGDADLNIAPFPVKSAKYGIAVQNIGDWPAVVQAALGRLAALGIYHSVTKSWGVAGAELGDFVVTGPVRPEVEVSRTPTDTPTDESTGASDSPTGGGSSGPWSGESPSESSEPSVPSQQVPGPGSPSSEAPGGGSAGASNGSSVSGAADSPATDQ